MQYVGSIRDLQGGSVRARYKDESEWEYHDRLQVGDSVSDGLVSIVLL